MTASKIAIGMVCGLLLTGCTTSSKEVTMRMIIPPTTAGAQLPEDQGFLMAELIQAPVPEFPSGLSMPDGRVDICVELVVTAEGGVENAWLADDVDGCTSHPPPALVHAAIRTVREWEFIAAAHCQFPLGAKKTDDCSGEHVVVEAVPVRLIYGFAFEQRRGKRRVVLGTPSLR